MKTLLDKKSHKIDLSGIFVHQSHVRMETTVPKTFQEISNVLMSLNSTYEILSTEDHYSMQTNIKHNP